jgi:DNA-binding NarL/FixJ family response regulator
MKTENNETLISSADELLSILIVDDHPLVLEGLKSLLANEPHISLVATAKNAYEAIDFLKQHKIDIAFLDINLPDISGIDLCKKIVSEFPTVKCLALSTFSERNYISQMIQNGAMGYLIKSSSREEILQAIEQVNAGGFFMNVNLIENQLEKDKHKIPELTRREKEVLILISEGLTNQQIADKLFVSVLTVNSHRSSLLLKFEVNNTASLIKIAAQNQLL